ncbi:hypothetical protein BUALT_Bualt14G0033500 [Buddleja alternifolia]|uniref:RING-CH-type domain-containing protein n=1 Tax=Buddleja alternifolia TaxID=168488 RepID=A0AAV6WFV9_9LAMI|nr:hypothetical protein BUALT_Bualt14G0033500 [Buddleja alternifolia]
MEAKAKGVVNLLSESSSSSSDEDRIIQGYSCESDKRPPLPKPEVGEQLIVKVKALTHGSLDVEREEMIPEVEAVCRFCYDIFQADNVLKTKCRCKFTLAHEECSRKQSNIKCTACVLDIEYIPVTLSRAKGIQSTPPKSSADKQKHEKPSSTTKR